MSPALVWSNILAYSLQIGLLVGLGALAPAVLRMRMPRARLLYWQVLLVACLALPWVRNWRQEVVAGTIQVSGVVTAAASSSSAPVHRTIPFAAIALWILAAGVAIRLGWLAVGLARLAVYRRRGQDIPRNLRPPGAMASAALLLSDDVAGPVTFGWRDPVVLLPASFPTLDAEMRDAIVCHELLHVHRRDWLFTISEELVRAVLWFHPAIWWVIGEIQLAREQTVDQAVIETTQARGPYVDTLLLMAGASVSRAQAQLDLAPAPMFLRRRHLRRRLMEVVKEVSMPTVSKARWICVMSVATVMLAATCWLATGAFPLMAAPQVVNDAAGVAVNINGSQLMHRASVPYPAEALAKGVEGTVVVQMKLDANGEVSDATVLSGPDELRKGVLQSVLTWHFDKSAASSTRVVNIDFVRPVTTGQVRLAETMQRSQQPVPAPRQATTNPANMAFAPPPPPPPPPTSGKLDRIVVTGLSDSARAELLSRLPVHEGGEWSGQMFAAVTDAVKQFDPHLTIGLARFAAAGGQLELRIGLSNSGGVTLPNGTFVARYTAVGQGSGVGYGSGSGGPVAAAFQRSDVFSVGNGTTPPSVLSKVDPEYSEEARAAKYSGSVMLSVVVGTDGRADDINVVKSLGLGLDEKAVEAVQRWVFKPGMNQGVPVKVRAQIEINFRLLDKE